MQPMPSTLLTNCSLVDVINGDATPNAEVLIDDNRIVAIGTSSDVPRPSDARVVDLRGGDALPGLFNMHVHFGLILPGAAGDRMLGESEAALALRMARNAEEALLAGVTTVRLLGEAKHVDFALKASIA